MIIVEVRRAVIGGVDTHLDVHVAAALDAIGGLLGVESFEASRAGNDKFFAWLHAFGPITGRRGGHRLLWGRPGPVHCAPPGWRVVEVDRPNRQPAAGRQVRPARRGRGGPCRPVGAGFRAAKTSVLLTATWRPSGR